MKTSEVNASEAFNFACGTLRAHPDKHPNPLLPGVACLKMTLATLPEACRRSAAFQMACLKQKWMGDDGGITVNFLVPRMSHDDALSQRHNIFRFNGSTSDLCKTSNRSLEADFGSPRSA